MGRYISADPIGLDGGINLYAYTEGDPINWYDSNGLAKTSIQAAIDNCLALPSIVAKVKCLEGLLDGIVCDQKNIKRVKQHLRSLRNKKKGSENRQKNGGRERNRAHKDSEEHSRVPKGGFRK